MARKNTGTNCISVINARLNAIDHAAGIAYRGKSSHQAFLGVLGGPNCRFIRAQRLHFVSAACQRQMNMRINQSRNNNTISRIHYPLEPFFTDSASPNLQYKIIFNNNVGLFLQRFVAAVKNAAILD